MIINKNNNDNQNNDGKNDDNLGEFVNYHHPDPRRVWKAGSGLRLLTPFPVDPVDLADCAENSKIFDLEQPSRTFALRPPLLGISKLIYVSSDNFKIDIKRKENQLKTQVISQSMIRNHYFHMVFYS